MPMIRRLSIAGALLASSMTLALPTAADPALETRDTMWRIAQAIDGRHHSLNLARYCVWSWGTFDRTVYPLMSHAEAEALLVPDHLDELPAVDAWGHPFEFRFVDRPYSLSDIAVLSPGADGVFEATPYTGGYITDPHDDLVWADRVFVRQPLIPSSLWRDQAAEAIGEMGTWLTFWYSDHTGTDRPLPTEQTTVDFSTANPVDPATLFERLVPSPELFAYTRCIPPLDPWGTPYEVVDFFAPEQIAWPPNDVVFGLRSAGSDGVFEGAIYDRQAVGDPTADLVWAGRVPFRFPTLFADGFESGTSAGWDHVVDPD
ncbi:MAG: hypothetical protein AAGE94_06485 [Acidobacteriota bacterium]